jgi:peptidoglycan/LPS O-acetylase OafA/YrhL
MKRTLEREPKAGRQAASRYPEIDAVKGLALLGVLVIHAQPLDDAVVFQHVINRAVSVLLVLFGVSSELWWARRSAEPVASTVRSFWRERLVRLLPPVWATAAVWWAIRLLFARRPAPAWPWLFAHGLGYLPQVGTAWFVTLIVQLVLLFPLLHFAVARLGALAALLVSLGISVFCHLHTFAVVDVMRALLFDSANARGFFVFYYAWIFAPLSFLPVVAGIIMAQRRMAWSRGWSLAALGVWLVGSFAHERLLTDGFARNALMAALDIPCTLLLLDLVRVGDRLPGFLWLRWIGKASWGMYLGQMLVHTSLQLFGIQAGRLPSAQRWLYFAALFAGGVTWVLLGRAARASFRKLAAVSAPQPESARLSQQTEETASAQR